MNPNERQPATTTYAHRAYVGGVADLLDMGTRANVPLRRVGTVGGEILRLGRSEAPFRDLRSAYESGLTKMLD